MDKISLIECREADASLTVAPGSWSTVLAEPQWLMPNDQVLLKQCSIDTRNVLAGSVVIEKTLTDVKVEAYPYVVNSTATDKEFLSGMGGGGRLFWGGILVPKLSKNSPKVVPKLRQNHPKITPKSSQIHPNVIPK